MKWRGCFLFFLLSFYFITVARGQLITFSVKNERLEKVFLLIEQQSDHHFIYTTEQIEKAKPVTLSVSNEQLSSVLNKCFSGQPLLYNINEKNITVKEKKIVASEHVLRGKVLDQNDNPVRGVTINIKGTPLVVASDSNGEFGFDNVPANATLVLTSVEIEPLERYVGNQESVEILVSIKVGVLDETIIKGYYATSKRYSTGSSSKITDKTIQLQPVSNPLATLQGRVSGLFITQGSGIPGSNFTVLIRGKNSLQNGNSPFYVIDGVPFLSDADRTTQLNSINSNSPFNSLNPDDIESIEVLKDADATAIYGSRGANGVILITTRKAKAGKTSVALNAYTGWGSITRSLEFLNTEEYITMRKEALANDGVVPSLSNDYDLLSWDTTRYRDWRNDLIGNTSHSKKLNLRVSGGNEFTSFHISGDYYKETTVFPSDDLYNQRLSSSLGVTHNSKNKALTISFSSSFASDQNYLAQQDLSNLIKLPPNAPNPFDSIGRLNFREKGFSFSNPYANLLKTYTTIINRFNSSLNIKYKIISSLTAVINCGYSFINTDETVLIPIASKDPSTSPTGNTQLGKNNFKSWIVEPQLEYTKGLKHSTLTALVGSTFQENKTDNSTVLAFGITNDGQLLNMGNLPQSNITYSNFYNQYRYGGFYARLNYNLYNKYIVNLTGRRDGSSRFGPGKQFANFGAVGLGWVLSNENFLKKLYPALSFAKFRSSYGSTGNDKIGDYQYLDAWIAASAYQNSPAIRPARLFNNKYAWESIKKLELGIDLGFCNDRILLTANWFKNRSDNQLIKYNLPAQTGFVSIFKNFPGVVQNTGIEFEINTSNIVRRSFKWTSSFNLTASNNKLISFPGLESSSYATNYLIGEPINLFLGYQFKGVDPQTGLYTFEDRNRDGILSPRSATSMNDFVVAGTTDPKFYGGFQNRLEFKGLSLEFLFQFISQKGLDPIYSNSTPPGFQTNIPRELLKRWTKPGDISPYQRFSQSTGVPYLNQQYVARSTAALTDASFIRLKNLSISYSFLNVMKKYKIEKFELYIHAQNLITITKITNEYKGLDPENQSFSFLPPLRMISTGIQIIF